MAPSVEIVDLEWQREAEFLSLKIGTTYRTAFTPKYPDNLLGSLSALRTAVRWSWLQWRAKPEFAPIQDALRFVVLRAADGLLAKRLPKDSFRGLHDRMLLCCAVLSADDEAMRVAAERTMGASSRGNAKARELGLAGILRARIRSDQAMERRQLQIMEDSFSIKSDPIPSKKLIHA